MKAFVFPGQGSQFVGMGKDLAEAFPAAREVFQEVDDILNQKLSKIMFEGAESDLNLTENTQPALMAVSVAVARILSQAKPDLFASNKIKCVAGHSLGEYSALCAAGALIPPDRHGEAAAAARPGDAAGGSRRRGRDGGDPRARLREGALIALEAAKAHYLSGAICEAANDNGGGQVVISGAKAAVERAMELAKKAGAEAGAAARRLRAVPLHADDAGGRSDGEGARRDQDRRAHCAARRQRQRDGADRSPAIRESLARQVTGAVRWRESVAYMADQGVTRFLEIGAGKVLAGLVKRIADGASAISVGTPADVEAFKAAR